MFYCFCHQCRRKFRATQKGVKAFQQLHHVCGRGRNWAPGRAAVEAYPEEQVEGTFWVRDYWDEDRFSAVEMLGFTAGEEDVPG
jgi:hypothetical protein